jgi:lysophospholipase L1-like esterase
MIEKDFPSYQQRLPEPRRSLNKRKVLLLLLLTLVLLGALGSVIYWKSSEIKQAVKSTINGATPTPTSQPLGNKAPGSLISRDAPVFASESASPPQNANANNYNQTWRSLLTPAWLAYDLSGIPKAEREKVLVVWYNPHGGYDHTLVGENAYNNLKDYTIETNAAPGGGSAAPTSGWVERVKVTANTYHSRQHVIDMQGHNWLRIHVTASDGSDQNMDASINMDVYDTKKALEDDWIFYGDSITAGGMAQYDVNGVPSFAHLINQKIPERFPIQEGGGIGYTQSDTGAKYIDKWLQMFPGKYVGLSYGTNDAGSCVDPEVFYNNYVTMVQAVINAGKVPLVPTIPWALHDGVQRCAPSLNEKIEQLYQSYPQIVRGPDFWTFFKSNPHLISEDKLHPSDQGFGEYRKLWVEVALKSIYKVE